MKILVLLVFLNGVFAGNRVKKDDMERSVYQEAMDSVQACGNKEISLCLKERALKYLDNLPNNMEVGGGLRIKSNEPDRNNQTSWKISSVVLPDEPRAREEALDDVILEKVKEYVTSHTFEYRIPEGTFKVLDVDVEEGRKKKGGGGIRLRPMMMLLQVKAAMLGALALKVIGLIAFKALLIAKIALTIASIVALKKIVEPKHHTATYEVVAHPHYDEHSHYDRAFNVDLPYKGYNGARNIA